MATNLRECFHFYNFDAEWFWNQEASSAFKKAIGAMREKTMNAVKDIEDGSYSLDGLASDLLACGKDISLSIESGHASVHERHKSAAKDSIDKRLEVLVELRRLRERFFGHIVRVGIS